MIDLNKIYCEDCIDTMSRMPDGFIDLTITSPPYDNLRTYNDAIHLSWNDNVWKPIIKELYRVTKSGGVVVWVVGDATINGSETGTSFKQALWAKECGFDLHDTMIYEKNSSTFPTSKTGTRYTQIFEYMFIFIKDSDPITGENATTNLIIDKANKWAGYSSFDRKIKQVSDFSARTNIWKYATSFNDKVNHPAMFPEKLVRDHIYTWSNEGDIVYDPFMGSGTTAKMAHLQKRKWMGSEISQEYVDLANKRIKPYLDQLTLDI